MFCPLIAAGGNRRHDRVAGPMWSMHDGVIMVHCRTLIERVGRCPRGSQRRGNQPPRCQRLSRLRGQRHRRDARSRVDGVEAVAHRFDETPVVARRAGGASADLLDPVVDAVEAQIEPARPEPCLRERLAQRHQASRGPHGGLSLGDRFVRLAAHQGTQRISGGARRHVSGGQHLGPGSDMWLDSLIGLQLEASITQSATRHSPRSCAPATKLLADPLSTAIGDGTC